MFQTRNFSSIPSRPKLAVLQVVLVLVTLFSLLFVSTPSSALSSDTNIIVQLKAGVSISSINLSYGTTLLEQQANNTYTIAAQQVQLVDTLVAAMTLDSRLVNAEANYKAQSMQPMQSYMYWDPASVGENGLTSVSGKAKAKDQWAFKHIRLDEAQKLSKGKNIKVAVVDSGVNVNHPDLAGKTLPGRNIVAGNSDITDQSGHGTFVAGVIAQVAPEAKIIPVKVLNSRGYGTITDTANGIRWAADNDAKIINVSLGTYYESAELNSAISYARDVKGALIVASVGNNNTSNLRYPGSYHKSFSVAATDQNNRKTAFSNFGKERVRVTAPGVRIYSTYYKGGYAYGDGTSFSTPLVAGLSALVWAKKTDWKWDNVIGEIESKAVMLDKCDSTYGANDLGKGVIDAYGSLGGQPLKNKQFDQFTCQHKNPTV